MPRTQRPIIKDETVVYHVMSRTALDGFPLDDKDAEERLQGYRRYVYEAGAVDCSETGRRKVIEDAVVEKERKKVFKISRIDHFRYRTRYFTDSGIIGTKEFVATNYMRFKNNFMSKREKAPKPVAGLEGMYSLKRLTE